MNRGQIDRMDDLRELRRLFAGVLKTAPGVSRVASTSPDFKPAFEAMGRVSEEARVVAVACGDIVIGAVWATSTTFRLARALSRTTRR
jgi:hypothetical protein